MKSPLKAAIKSLEIIPAYKDNNVALVHGDCRSILPKLRNTERVVIVSDPPYGIKWVHSSNPRPIIGDDKPFDPTHLLPFKCILFGGQHYHTSLPFLGSWIIWDKRCPHKGGRKACNIGPCHTNDIGDYEDIWLSFHAHRTIFRHYWNGGGKATEAGIKRIHPTQKPVALMRWIIESYTSPEDLIIDPYAGSCATLLAARSLGRFALGIELDPQYIAPAVSRLQ
jgi:site-specific DNA-methyltransferase (adenine-specific)/modification methylase